MKDAEGIPFAKPALPPWDEYSKKIESFYGTGIITNGVFVRKLEEEVQQALSIPHAVALANCTSGLILTLGSIKKKGKVALPSFTFFATAHSVAWNGMEPVFVDVDEETWNISPSCLKQVFDEEEEIVAIMPVHVFGNPCDTEALAKIGEDRGAAIIYDSAHAMGAKVGEKWAGCFGDAEVFSLSPTKLITSGEGGLVATTQEELAVTLRAGRDYGNSGDYNPAFVGLNARMSEFHAALGVESFRMLEPNVTRRNEFAEGYKRLLADIPGIWFQKILEGNRSTFKDFTILIDTEEFGLDRDVLGWYLAEEGIDTRKYYFPPVHRTTAYWERWGKKYDESLPVTNRLSRSVLSLPIWSHMEDEVIARVVEKINDAHARSEEIAAAYSKKTSENSM